MMMEMLIGLMMNIMMPCSCMELDGREGRAVFKSHSNHILSISKMENKYSTFKSKRNWDKSLDLKNRLFEKGIGHSSVSSFKSPLANDQANRILLVNLTSRYTLSHAAMLSSPPRSFESRLLDSPGPSMTPAWVPISSRPKIMCGRKAISSLRKQGLWKRSPSTRVPSLIREKQPQPTTSTPPGP